MSGAGLRVHREGAVVRLTLARPPLNVLSMPLGRELAAAVHAAGADASVAAVVLDGDGRGFSAGVEVADHTEERIVEMLTAFHGAVRALLDCPCPTVALVHGLALGGGLELAIACDWVVTESDARLGLPEIQLGCLPPVAAALLPARIGWARASELVCLGQPIAPAAALAMGLVSRVCAPGEREREAAALLAPLLALSPAVVREAKQALRLAAGGAAAPALPAIEQRYVERLMQLADAQEGVAAFLQKRPPVWTNA